MVSNFVYTWAKYKHNGRHVEQNLWEIPESILANFCICMPVNLMSQGLATYIQGNQIS